MTKLYEHYRVSSVSGLLKITKPQLQSIFGPKTGESIFNHARGIDNQPLKLVHKRRTVGTQISWGVRFQSVEQVDKFIIDMAAEVSKRLKQLELVGLHVTLKILKKVGGEEANSVKYMNPGAVKNITKSFTLSNATDNPEILGSTCCKLFQQMHVLPKEVRGGGIQVDQLQDCKNRDPTSVQEPKTNQLTKYFSVSKKVFQNSGVEEKEEERKKDEFPDNKPIYIEEKEREGGDKAHVEWGKEASKASHPTSDIELMEKKNRLSFSTSRDRGPVKEYFFIVIYLHFLFFFLCSV
eukprot:TRINITY_DN691_c2_g1_i3.p1 TRINITY_DN691_c2_g1~~TRINITY_DN691_c2_g1_i3.p1  ORF type:complete len:294 (+),score=50.86 TRINITY_DN691_c2_g1_i3:962-1843(+)